MMTPLVWLVTGSTSGIGAALVQGIAARGDKVIATGRNAEERLAHLKGDNIALLNLDVTASKSQIDVQINKAMDLFGRVDVLINNAGMSSTSPLEEASEAFVAQIFGVNLFGSMKVTQAILPYMRAQRAGRIGFIGAGLAWGPFPFLGHYAMTKAALSIFVETLEKEVSPCGIHATIFECGGFSTGLGSKRSGDEEGFGNLPKAPEYATAFGELMQAFVRDFGPDVPGDTQKLPNTVIDVVKAEGFAKGRNWPVRVFIGPDSVAVARQKCQEQLQLCREWEDVTGMVSRDDWSGRVPPFLLETSSMLKKTGFAGTGFETAPK